MTIKMSDDRAWLEKLAERENQGVVSAGGWVARSLEQESGCFIVRLPQSLHAALEREAEQEGVSLNQLVVVKLAVQLSNLVQTGQP